ncbi:MAG TPA: hypothetical protein VGX72_02290 [Solirubrobacteraceae bacterium]|jgi:hypothetical protein|nr:hypothetical protein [Solirubrobacteraceae bacterium]
MSQLLCSISRHAAVALLAMSAGGIALPASASAVVSPLPSVSTGGVSNVTYSSAILYGGVNAHGQLTSYAFQYGPTSAFGAQSPLAPAGNGTVTIKVSQAITGLQPGVTYHYRVIATGPGGTVKGADRAFTTPKIPLSVQIVGVPDPVLFGNPFFVEGTLSGTGASTHEIVLQANPFPYLGGFKDVGNPEVANSTGGFSFPYVGLLENAQLRVVTVGSPVVVSPVVLESVAVRVSFHVRRARRRGFVRLYGDVAPAEVGALVGFQLLTPGSSINEGGTVVKAGTATVSRFSGAMRLRHPGLYRALIKVNDGAHVSNYSEPILIR